MDLTVHKVEELLNEQALDAELAILFTLIPNFFNGIVSGKPSNAESSSSIATGRFKFSIGPRKAFNEGLLGFRILKV